MWCYLFFDKDTDADWVLMNEPWTLDKHLVLLQRYDKVSPLNSLVFNKSLFWVQIFGLPVYQMDVDAAVETGKTLREVVHSLLSASGLSHLRFSTKLASLSLLSASSPSGF